MIGIRSRIGRIFAQAVVALALGQGAYAQDAIEVPVRIGVIAPAPGSGPNAALQTAVSRSSLDGAVFAEEEFKFNAELIGVDFAVLTETASGQAVVAAAEKLVAQGAFSILGGFTTEEGALLSAWAKSRGVPYFNIGASADSLRNELCAPTTFHVEPSAAMYLDSFVGWYVRSGFRRWYVVREDSAEGKALHDRLRWSMQERHFGAREVGASTLRAGAAVGADLANAVRRSGADMLMLLVSGADQLRIMGELDKAGIAIAATGFPYPETQTREFFAASAKIAPKIGTGHRAVAWEASIDAYGAREYNARYVLRYGGAPKESPAWAIYHAVKILYETALTVGSVEPKAIMANLMDPQSVFDLHKGIGVSFRPWDRQLRQSLFLVKINAEAENAMRRALLVGELPAIYLPGTDLIERLDQLGDLKAQSRCTQ